MTKLMSALGHLTRSSAFDEKNTHIVTYHFTAKNGNRIAVATHDIDGNDFTHSIDPFVDAGLIYVRGVWDGKTIIVEKIARITDADSADRWVTDHDRHFLFLAWINNGWHAADISKEPSQTLNEPAKQHLYPAELQSGADVPKPLIWLQIGRVVLIIVGGVIISYLCAQC